MKDRWTNFTQLIQRPHRKLSIFLLFRTPSLVLRREKRDTPLPPTRLTERPPGETSTFLTFLKLFSHDKKKLTFFLTLFLRLSTSIFYTDPLTGNSRRKLHPQLFFTSGPLLAFRLVRDTRGSMLSADSLFEKIFR